MRCQLIRFRFIESRIHEQYDGLWEVLLRDLSMAGEPNRVLPGTRDDRV